MPELIEKGCYRHPRLGVSGYALSPDPSRRVELGNVRVLAGGDIIVEIDDVAIDSNETLREFLETRRRFGQEVEVTFYRGDERMSTHVVLGERPV